MRFNVRVYGILINSSEEVLLSDEQRFGRNFTKFPGGGLQFGEGIKECLVREFQEELNISIEVKEVFYVTDFFQISAFDKNEQIISIYYKVTTQDFEKIKTANKPFAFVGQEQEIQRWRKVEELEVEEMTFPIDKKVAELLKKKIVT